MLNLRSLSDPIVLSSSTRFDGSFTERSGASAGKSIKMIIIQNDMWLWSVFVLRRSSKRVGLAPVRAEKRRA